MLMFRPGDRPIIPRKGRSRAYVYSCRAGYVAERLDLLGFTLDRTERSFRDCLMSVRRRLREIGRDVPTEVRSTYDSGLEYLRGYNYARWREALTARFGSKDRARVGSKRSAKTRYLSLVTDSTGDKGQSLEDEFFVGFPALDYGAWDILELMRGVVASTAPSAPVMLDYGELVTGGYVSADDELCDPASLEGLGISERILVLTEGSSDSRIIRKSMQVLRPHLVDYFGFMDFELSNAAGSANQLVSNIKAFIGAGIRYRVTAVFDNDTASEEAPRALSSCRIPENIKVVRLPDVEIARAYPTIGPQGRTSLDVNGLACSIEMYICPDLLRDAKGTLIPVQWRGFSEGLSKYQGEVLHKRELAAKFETLLDDVLHDPVKRKEHDWTAMSAVIDRILGAHRSCTVTHPKHLPI